MDLKPSSMSGPTAVYACSVSGCLISYETSKGYFVSDPAANPDEQEIMPGVVCPNDGHAMYLAQVLPERSSFRLWKCPKCGASLTNEESSPKGKKQGA